MAFNREERVADEVRRIVSELISSELDDPRVPAFTSITDVRVSRDFNYADLHISVLAGDREVQEAAVKALNKAKGFLRKGLSQRIKLRVTPELRFHLDDSYEKGQRIDELLAELKAGKSTDTTDNTELESE